MEIFFSFFLFPIFHSPSAREILRKQKELEKHFSYCTLHRAITSTYGHIITGDLDIVTNSNLKTLPLKGLNYRDQESPNNDSTLHAITSAIDVYVQKISEKTNVAIRRFSAWKKRL